MTNKQKITSLIMALTLGGVAGHHIDDIVEKYNIQTDDITEKYDLQVNRYPIETEYEIINNCISNDEKPIAREIYLEKKEVCICALEKTELDYSYYEYYTNYNTFLDKFELKANECMSTMR